MIQIKPVSDLRNNFTEIESIVKTGSPVYLTKNGYGSMVVMSIESYSKLTESVEDELDIADKMAEETNMRYTHEEVFSKLRENING
ncbi:MAG: type II toxin-antitoxin system Phd/YefM family antitoxin [Lachnospira sp.]